MKTPRHDETARKTMTSSEPAMIKPNEAEDSISDPWRQMIELIAQQLVKAWAKESK